MTKLPWQPVHGSSWIVRASYDPDTEEMEIQTDKGKVYTYPGVSISVYNGFLKAASPGQYLHQNIMNG
jgi:hypothetical protein